MTLFSDPGNGKFDGANLVQGFEDLNPGNPFRTKQYNVYANADTEEHRYLDFERWWNGYYYMTSEEIRFIVNNLFVGNRLEQGLLELDAETRIDLKKIKQPILVLPPAGIISLLPSRPSTGSSRCESPWRDSRRAGRPSSILSTSEFILSRFTWYLSQDGPWVNKPSSGVGPRLIIVNAITKDGWVNNARLIFEEKKGLKTIMVK